LKLFTYICPVNFKLTIMKRKLFFSALALFLSFSSSVFAGGLLTNTNQNVTFLRNPARGASIEIDAAYTNPAGLAFLKIDGFHLSVNNQSAFQTRTITTEFAPFAGFCGNVVKEFEGTAQALIIPNLQAAYKIGKWVFSANIGIVGGGGTLDFSKGLPSFESQVALLPLMLSQSGIPATQYALDSRLEGSSVIYGIQLGATYKFNDYFSAYLGGRANIVNNSYEGYIRNIQANVGGNLVNLNSYFTEAATQATGAANSLQQAIDGGYGNTPLHMVVSPEQLTQMAAGLGLSETQAGALTVNEVQGAFFQKATQAEGVANQTADKELNCKQKGFGIAPIIGLNYNWKGLNIGVKYEFKTALQLENETTENSTGVEAYNDKVKTPYDIPALLTIGVQYDIIPQVTVSVGYHHFFDSNAKMANDKQKFINGGVNEYLAGIEYRINDMFLVSCGTQITRQGVTDDYQSDMSFAINSYSLGFGGAIRITQNFRVNLAYFITNYSNWSKSSNNYGGVGMAGTDIFGRTNQTFGIGLDFRF